MVIIGGRVLVGRHKGLRSGSETGFDAVQIAASEEIPLLGIVKAVQTYILGHSGCRIVVKSIDERRQFGNQSPSRGIHLPCSVRFGKSVFERTSPILQDIFRAISKVEKQGAAAMVRLVDEGIHHPKLDKLNVSCLKVVRFHPPLHPPPSGCRVQ